MGHLPSGGVANASGSPTPSTGRLSPPGGVSPIDSLFAAAAVAGAAARAAQRAPLALDPMGSGSASSITHVTDTDGCCPTIGDAAMGSSNQCSASTGAGGGFAGMGFDEAPRKLAVLGLPWDTT